MKRRIFYYTTLQIGVIFERRGKIRRFSQPDIRVLSITFVLVDAGLFLLQTTNISFHSEGNIVTHMR